MPWDNFFTALAADFMGPLGLAFISTAIVLGGVMWAFNSHGAFEGSFLRYLGPIAFGGGLILGAARLIAML